MQIYDKEAKNDFKQHKVAMLNNKEFIAGSYVFTVTYLIIGCLQVFAFG